MKLKFDTKKAQPFFGALAASWLCLAPVWADDTEIFFAETTESNVWPNVLFVIDTSGSMRNEVDDPNNPDKDRLEHVQEAMRTVLTELNEVNVGLMRFSNPGGPVLFPVTRLDQEIVRDPMVTIVSEVSSDDDDASEIRSSNVVLLNDNTLYLTSALVGGSTWTSFIDEWEDDAEEDIDDGDVTRNSNDLDFYGADNGSARIIGLHFRGSDIPNGATINSAFIQFTGIDGGDSDQADAIVYGEDLDGPSDNIGSFGSGDDNLSDRDLTTASVAWTVTDSVADGDKITTPDLSAIVQEVVNDSGWDPGSDEDDMNFLIYPTGNNDGHKRFVSLQDDDAAAIEDRATLVVNYGATSTEDVVSAMRFQNVNVPKGVDVTNAYIEFVAPTNSAGAYDLVIYGEDSSTPAAFTDSNGDISGRSPASTTVAWSGSDSVDAGDTFRTPDISGIVQEIAARSDWCGGDAMVLAVNGSPGPLSGFSHDGDPTQSARLVVTYDLDTVPEGTSCFNDVASRRVTSSLDDAEENGSDVSITGDTLNLESGNNIGVRFRGLDVPKDATIKRAYLEFTARDDDDGNTTLTIAVESTDDADSYQGVDDTVDGRSYGGSVSWSITEDWDDDSTYRSPDIKALVQSIVDRSGWAAGNAMAFRVVNSGSNDREAFSFNRSPGDAPRLVVEFESDGTGDEIYTARDELLSIIDTLSHNGYTPIQDTMYEAAQYYTGGEVLYGKARGADDGGPFAYTRVSSEGAMVPGTFNINYPDGCSAANLDDEACADQTITGVGGNPKYESPITNACQGNHIILLTDGYPNRDNSESLVQSFIGSSSCTDTGAVDDDGDVTGGVCVQDLVKHIANTDQSPLGGDQLIKTHPIGFAFSDDWLRNLAGQDNGADPDAAETRYNSVNTASELAGIIKATIGEILKDDSTFVAPVAAVNQFNRLNHLSNIYFAVFRPDEQPRWPGNVKKYVLGANNEVLDSRGDPVVDASSGFFLPSSRDLWDAGSDPNDPGQLVETGGAASQLPTFTTRNVYTHYTGASNILSNNRLHSDEIDPAGLNGALFGDAGMSNDDLTDLIDWIRGESDEVDGQDRYSFGDPLHSRPVAVTYNISESDPDVEIFVGSNAGALQAINAKTGVETFAFYPEETLAIQPDLRENSTASGRIYGLDGNIVPWIRDVGADGITAGGDDFVRLFFGMRRGGTTYYAMDVTDRDRPELMWKITGGEGDYAEMGESWGTPIPGRIQLSGQANPTDVLFISGGYDVDKDDQKTRQEDDSGRGIFIVDAVTGDLIWSGTPEVDSTSATAPYNKQFAAMQYSIPSTLTVADVNADGLDDIIVVGDTGGQLWRFDLRIGGTLDKLVDGAVIADLGVAGDNLDPAINKEEFNRRFFHAPDIALAERNGERELAITIGSGFRPSPLSKVTQDRFYMLRQTAVFGPPAAYETITQSMLYDATDNRVADGERADGSAADILAEEALLGASKGWYIDLHDPNEPGEKVLSTPLTFDDRVVFITYTPSPSVSNCKPVAGVSRVYFVNLGDASPVREWTDQGADCSAAACDEVDRVYDLSTASIIDEPVFICTGEGCDVFTGAERPPIPTIKGNRVRRSYWRKDN